jgi:hypothetical protein
MTLLTGKLANGLLGLSLPFFAFIGALRLGKPSSFSAKRFDGERKLLASEKRFGAHCQARMERLRGRLSGMTSIH